MPFGFMRIDKAYIPITIGRLKAPCPTTRFNCKKYFYLMFLLNTAQMGRDCNFVNLVGSVCFLLNHSCFVF